MSKLYKNLQYDTDYVMQPGDPLTSPNGDVEVHSNDDGTASVSSPAVESYDVTFTIPDVSGVTITARVSNLSNEYPTYTVLSAIGIENPTFSGSTINSNGEYWGEIAMKTPADEAGVTDTTKIWPNGRVVNLFVRSLDSLSQWTTVSSYTVNYGSGRVSKTLVTSEAVDKKMNKVSTPVAGRIATVDSYGNVVNGSFTEDELVTNARKSYYGYCETTGNNSAKTVNTTLTFDSMYTGLVVYIKFRYANITQNPTLNVNGKGAHNIYRYGTTSDFTTTSTGYQTLSWRPNEVVGFVYDGSAWMMLKPAEASINNQGVVKLSNTYSSQITDAQHAAPTQKALYDAYTALNTSKANSSDLGDAASKDVGTTSGTVAAGDHTHDAANITYNDNASYNTVAACLTDLVNTNLWVENNATNIMRGDKAITTLTLKGKTIATTDQIPDAQIQSDWNQTTTTAKDYIKNKPTLGAAAAMGVGTGSNQVAAGNHTHSDYVSKSATSQQSLSGDLYIAQGKSLNLGSAEASGGKVEIAAASATDESSTYMLVGTVGGEYVWIGKDGIGYTTNNENTSTKLSFPTPPSSGQKTGVIATTDQLLQIGTTATTAAAGNHTHSGYAASSHNHAAGDINSGTLAVARGGTGADGSSITKNYVLAAPSGSNGAVSFRALVAADIPSHTHDNYLDKSATTLQTLSGSVSIPHGKELIMGEPADGYGINLSSYSNNVLLLISKDFDEYCWLTSNGIGFTTDGESTETTLSYPEPAKSGVIATDYDIRKMTRVLYESVTGDSSTPATSITISEDYNVYSFWLAANGTFPTFTFSFPNFSSVAARFPFTLIVDTSLVTASTLTGPSGWAWVSGATLPSSGFTNKHLWISGIIKTNDSTAVPLVSCWRCA